MKDALRYSHALSRLGGMVTACTIAFGAFCAPAFSEDNVLRAAPGEVVQINAPASTQQSPTAARPFSTMAQRAAVKPMVWDGTARNPDTTVPAVDSRAPRPNLTGGGNAPSFGDYMARNDFPDAWKVVDKVAASENNRATGIPDIAPQDGPHYPFTRFLGNYYTSQWTVPPWNKIGKLYFNVPGGGSSYCTASVASGNSVILTAAHCAYTRGAGWNYNFVFVPADRYGAAPYGSYGWQTATILTDWINIGGRRHDVAAIKLTGERSTGLPVVNYVGWLGRSWDWGYEQWTYSHGYASNFSTQYTNVCAGWTFYAPSEGTDVLVQGCDMTYGSSGGPWLRNFTHNSHAGNHVNSVVSGPHIGAFGTYYVGARFSSSNLVPICNAIGC